MWYENTILLGKDPLERLSSTLLDYVSEISDTIPRTFVFDWQRLELLRHGFRVLCAKSAISKTIECLLSRYGAGKWRNEGSITKLLLAAVIQRLEKMNPALSLWDAFQTSSGCDSMLSVAAMEIARATSVVTRNTPIPLREDISMAANELSRLMMPQTRPPTTFQSIDANHNPQPTHARRANSSNSAAADLLKEVRNQLQALVLSELGRMRDMPAAEICSKYVLSTFPMPAHGSLASVPLQTGLGLSCTRSPQNAGSSLRSPSSLDHSQMLAQRIAHMVVIHWRVWGPIIRSIADGGGP
jgi:T-complex protein 11